MSSGTSGVAVSTKEDLAKQDAKDDDEEKVYVERPGSANRGKRKKIRKRRRRKKNIEERVGDRGARLVQS